MSRPAADDMRVPAIDVIVEASLWDAGADATVRRALTEAAAAIGANFRNCSLAVLLTDDAAIRRLNAQWRGIDKPTNVLSFPSPPARPGTAAGGDPKSLGDVAIAYETAAREARAEGKPFADHLAHLSVHGFLHLLGYDHESEAQAETMESLERAILARLGVPDPYGAFPGEVGTGSPQGNATSAKNNAHEIGV
jgi:probable rRNA maturation factor